MRQRQQSSTLFPYTTLFRSDTTHRNRDSGGVSRQAARLAAFTAKGITLCAYGCDYHSSVSPKFHFLLASRLSLSTYTSSAYAVTSRSICLAVSLIGIY